MRPGETSINAAQAMMEQLQQADARIVSVVLNQIPRKRVFYYGGYRHYYAPYYEYTGGRGASGQKAGQRQGPLQWALNRLHGTTG